jgi:hypothetical protein
MHCHLERTKIKWKGKRRRRNDNIAGDKGSLNGDPMRTVIMDPGMGQEMAADGD